MDASNIANLPSKRAPLDKVLLPAAGYDEDILNSCPPHDWNVARGRGVLMIVYTFMEAAVYGYVLHRLFAAPGEIRPWLIFAGIGMAFLVTIIDLELIIKPTAVRKGQQLLKRGGLDIGFGKAEIMTALLASAVRVVLALGISQLNGVFISTLIYNKDIAAQIHNDSAAKNAGQIAGAEAAAERTIQRVTQGEAEQSARVVALTKQLEMLRQTEIESPEIQEARNEVNRLAALKANSDEGLHNAEKFASDEGAGIRGSTGNSGRAGYGFRYRAAVEQLTNARRRAQDAARELEAARTRLDALRDEKAPVRDTSDKQRARALRSELEPTLAAEREQLARLKGELADATNNREKNVREAVEGALGHVAVDDGLVAQLKALESIGHEGWTISGIILATDVVAFALELCAVLARTLGYATVYDAMLVRNIYLKVVNVADEMAAELRALERPDHDSPDDPRPNRPGGAKPPSGFGGVSDLFGNSGNPPPQPKRPRGRPPKNRPPT